MLLGLVLHAAASYVVTPLEQGWPFKDASTNGALDLAMFVIHLFRMPAFFLMAGFFAALVYERQGPDGFLRHRTRRVLLPLIVFWPLVVPLTGLGFLFARRTIGDEPLVPDGDVTLGHLWFLYYLFLFCLVARIIGPWLSRHASPHLDTFVDRFARWLPATEGSLAMGLVIGVSLLPMKAPGLDTVASLVPAPRVFAAYAVFFATGWLLWLRRESVATFAGGTWRALVLAVLFMTALLALAIAQPFETAWANHAAPRLAAGLAMWQLIACVVGLFIRYAQAERPLTRYLADASYWMYLTHLPVVIWTAGLLAPVPMPALAKFAIVVAVTAAVTIASYHWCVRSTAVGAWLNGKAGRRTRAAIR